MTALEKCEKLHRLFNGMKINGFTKDEINNLGFKNGVYIVFEKGEEAHGVKRVVRIGTHTQPDNLINRLKTHITTNGASVFRRKIAYAILNKWKISDNKFSHLNVYDYKKIYKNKLYNIKDNVSSYIIQNMNFAAFPIKNTKKEEKGTLFWEAKIIATIAHCNKHNCSKNWLGNFMPDELGKIKKAKSVGLWLSAEIDSSPLTDDEFVELEQIILHGKRSF